MRSDSCDRKDLTKVDDEQVGQFDEGAMQPVRDQPGYIVTDIDD